MCMPACTHVPLLADIKIRAYLKNALGKFVCALHKTTSAQQFENRKEWI